MASATSPANLTDLLLDGRWLAHRYEAERDAVHFRFVEEATLRGATFLIDREIGDGAELVFSRQDCLAAVRPLALPAPRFIFHSAYCCSTLMARAFDQAGNSTAYREPVILNDIAGLQLRGGDPRQIAAALDIALLLLARPLGNGEPVVVKPSNLVNPTIPAILAMRPEARIVLLHAPLQDYLGSVARKGLEGRAWVRELMWKLIKLGQATRFGFSEEDLYRQTDVQVAATGWLAQHSLFAQLADAAPQNVRTLVSDQLTGDPRGSLSASAAHFGIDLNVDAVIAAGLFATHSKDGGIFGDADRKADRAAGLKGYQQEIDTVVQWAEAVAAHVAAPMTLPSPLL